MELSIESVGLISQYISPLDFPHINNIAHQIGSFRQYCIKARKYLYSHVTPQYYLSHVVLLTFFVVQRIGRGRANIFYDECQIIIDSEFSIFSQNRLESQINQILHGKSSH